MRARVSSEPISSRTRRDLPIPGVPMIVASSQDRAWTAFSNASRRTASSSLRPTKGVRIGRENAGTSGLTAISRQAASGSLFPFASTGATASATTFSPTTLYVSAPSSTSPGAAACSNRAATLTASPVASRWSAAESTPPTTTSPVLTPVRVVIRMPCSRSSSSFSRSSACAELVDRPGRPAQRRLPGRPARRTRPSPRRR